ncbi:MAG: hypothetical protein ACOC04_05840 [Halothece sp.]
MAKQDKKKVLPNENPREAEPGRGAPGNQHYGVQTAQTTAVNPPDEIIPTQERNAQESKEQLEAYRQQEKGTGMDTTGGYVINDAGNLDNVAVEPDMYVEEQ